jgi:hypothetical protein
VRTGTREEAKNCGAAPAKLDLARLDAAVLPLDEATRAHVREIAARGARSGRQMRTLGLVGDSMTISGDFLRPFNVAPRELASEVDASLAMGKANVIDFYEGDAFNVYRAAKSGVRAGWALSGTPSPLAQMIEKVSPAVAIVLYGGNDAAVGPWPLERVVDEFSRDLLRIVDELERAGIVPVLNTVARHGHAPGVDDCGPPSAMSNWRIAVNTNAVSARVVEIACERHLPLIDLRHALDAADARGLGPDGVHLGSYRRGAGVLTAQGLRCGANVRNYVTLKMLTVLLPLTEPQ